MGLPSGIVSWANRPFRYCSESTSTARPAARSWLTMVRIEIAEPEVDHPLLVGATEHVRLGAEDGPHRWTALLLPYWFVVAPRWHIDAQLFGVPSPKPVRVRAPQEHAADASHPFHLSRLPTK